MYQISNIISSYVALNTDLQIETYRHINCLLEKVSTDGSDRKHISLLYVLHMITIGLASHPGLNINRLDSLPEFDAGGNGLNPYIIPSSIYETIWRFFFPRPILHFDEIHTFQPTEPDTIRDPVDINAPVTDMYLHLKAIEPTKAIPDVNSERQMIEDVLRMTYDELDLVEDKKYLRVTLSNLGLLSLFMVTFASGRKYICSEEDLPEEAVLSTTKEIEDAKDTTKKKKSKLTDEDKEERELRSKNMIYCSQTNTYYHNTFEVEGSLPSLTVEDIEDDKVIITIEAVSKFSDVIKSFPRATTEMKTLHRFLAYYLGRTKEEGRHINAVTLFQKKTAKTVATYNQGEQWVNVISEKIENVAFGSKGDDILDVTRGLDYFYQYDPLNIAPITLVLFINAASGQVPGRSEGYSSIGWSQPDVNQRDNSITSLKKAQEGFYHGSAQYYSDVYSLMPYAVVELNSDASLFSLTAPIQSSINSNTSISGHVVATSLTMYADLMDEIFEKILNSRYSDLYKESLAKDKETYKDEAEHKAVYCQKWMLRFIDHINKQFQQFQYESHLDAFIQKLKQCIFDCPKEDFSDPKVPEYFCTGMVRLDTREHVFNLNFASKFKYAKMLFHCIMPFRIAVLDGSHRITSLTMLLLNEYTKDLVPEKKITTSMKSFTTNASVRFYFPNHKNKDTVFYHEKVSVCDFYPFLCVFVKFANGREFYNIACLSSILHLDVILRVFGTFRKIRERSRILQYCPFELYFTLGYDFKGFGHFS